MKFDFAHITALLILFCPFAVLLYDISAAIFGGVDATITFVIQRWSSRFAELPWLAAGLFVFLWLHLFGKQVFDRMNGH